LRALFNVREKIVQYALQIGNNIVVPIADYQDAFFSEPTRSSFIGTKPPFGVLSAVNLNREPKACAIKVGRKWPDRMLSSEAQSVEPIAA
jgi:hypothetical protein